MLQFRFTEIFVQAIVMANMLTVSKHSSANSLILQTPNVHSPIRIIELSRGGSMVSGKGVHMYKGVRVHFADFISFFLNIP